MKRILFVDDELAVLDGLRLRLHRLSSKWEMVFVDSGPRAVEQLQTRPFDVVVTDMRMPGMDGAELLHIVRERYPEVIRIVLSGYAEMKQTMRLVPVAHQYLSKPCEPAQLENVIERCLQLHELLRHPRLRAIVGRLRRLPALPRTYSQLQAAMAREDVTVQDVARVISADSAIAAKVLQMVNSAFFRLARRITNIEQAVTYLGFAPVRNLVMSAEVFAQWDSQQQAGIDLDVLQTQVLRVTAVTNALVTGTPISDDAMLAALLHDIGYWVLAHESPSVLAESIRLSQAESMPLHAAELQVLGASHAEVGAYLLGLWGMPFPIVEAVAYHHAPDRVKQREFDVLAALVVGRSLTNALERLAFAGEGIPAEPSVDPAYLASLQAPFDLAEAQRRAAAALNVGAPS